MDEDGNQSKVKYFTVIGNRLLKDPGLKPRTENSYPDASNGSEIKSELHIYISFRYS